MLKRLATMGLIEMIPGVACFNGRRREAGAGSRERHQIIENFLLVLGVSPEIARRDAEGMEHHVSEETLDAFRLFTQKHGCQMEACLFTHAARRSFFSY